MRSQIYRHLLVSHNMTFVVCSAYTCIRTVWWVCPMGRLPDSAANGCQFIACSSAGIEGGARRRKKSTTIGTSGSWGISMESWTAGPTNSQQDWASGISCTLDRWQQVAHPKAMALPTEVLLQWWFLFVGSAIWFFQSNFLGVPEILLLNFGRGSKKHIFLARILHAGHMCEGWCSDLLCLRMSFVVLCM